MSSTESVGLDTDLTCEDPYIALYLHDHGEAENSGSHHLHIVKCYNYTEPQQVARKVVFTGPCVGEAGAAGPSNHGGAKVNPDKSAKKSKDGK